MFSVILVSGRVRILVRVWLISEFGFLMTRFIISRGGRGGGGGIEKESFRSV